MLFENISRLFSSLNMFFWEAPISSSDFRKSVNKIFPKTTLLRFADTESRGKSFYDVLNYVRRKGLLFAAELNRYAAKVSWNLKDLAAKFMIFM